MRWKNLVGRLKKVPDRVPITEFDPIQDWIDSPEFQAFVREQMEKEVRYDSGLHLSSVLNTRKPMQGLEKDPSVRAYRFVGLED